MTESANFLLEQSPCFNQHELSYTTESNTCLARSSAGEGQVLAPWTDGTWWLDVDGVTQVGWYELDGEQFPPFVSYPQPYPP